MSDSKFYVAAVDGNRLVTKYVPAKFLTRNGAYVTDPTPGGSQRTDFYSGPAGSDLTNGTVANPNNYLVVPANYSEEKARDFAAGIAKMANTFDPDTGDPGLDAALARMASDFSQGGAQDLQRHPQWGIPRGSVVPAFVGSASDHLGYVTAQAGLPVQSAEIGGGALNGLHRLVQKGKDFIGLPHDDKPIDTSGPYWLSQQNEANIQQGYSDGLAAKRRPAPFDAEAGAQAPLQSSQLGNGIADWTSSLSGIDPDEAPPSASPPWNRPVRYLARLNPSQGSPAPAQPAPSPASPDGLLSLNDAYLEYLKRLNAGQLPADSN